MLNKGKAIMMPMRIRMAGLIALFQKGFFAVELPSLAITPPDRGLKVEVKPQYVNGLKYSMG
jgi:hypothetical protein